MNKIEFYQFMHWSALVLGIIVVIMDTFQHTNHVGQVALCIAFAALTNSYANSLVTHEKRSEQ